MLEASCAAMAQHAAATYAFGLNALDLSVAFANLRRWAGETPDTGYTGGALEPWKLQPGNLDKFAAFLTEGFAGKERSATPASKSKDLYSDDDSVSKCKRKTKKGNTTKKGKKNKSKKSNKRKKSSSNSSTSSASSSSSSSSPKKKSKKKQRAAKDKKDDKKPKRGGTPQRRSRSKSRKPKDGPDDKIAAFTLMNHGEVQTFASNVDKAMSTLGAKADAEAPYERIADLFECIPSKFLHFNAGLKDSHTEFKAGTTLTNNTAKQILEAMKNSAEELDQFWCPSGTLSGAKAT